MSFHGQIFVTTSLLVRLQVRQANSLDTTLTRRGGFLVVLERNSRWFESVQVRFSVLLVCPFTSFQPFTQVVLGCMFGSLPEIWIFKKISATYPFQMFLQCFLNYRDGGGRVVCDEIGTRIR